MQLGASTIRDVRELSSIKKKQSGGVRRPKGQKKQEKVTKVKKRVPSKPKVKGAQRGKGDIFS